MTTIACHDVPHPPLSFHRTFPWDSAVPVLPASPTCRAPTRWLGVVGVTGLATLATARCDSLTAGSVPRTSDRVIWQYPFDTKGSHTAPLVLDSVVVFATNAGVFVALDRRTGRLRWERSVLPGQPIYAHAMATAGGRILAPAYSVVAFDLADGSKDWAFNPSDDVGDESIAVAGSLALGTATSGWLYAFDALTGVERWRRNVGERPFGVVAAGDRVYLGTRGRSSGGLGAGHLLALNAGDGSEVWRVSVPDLPGLPYTGGSIGFPAVLPDRIVFTTCAGSVYAVRPETGDTIWTNAVGLGTAGGYYLGPVSLGTVLVAVRRDGRVAGLDQASGHEVWSLKIGGAPVGPATDGTRAFVSDAQLLAITASGTIAWRFPDRVTQDDYISQPPAVRDSVVYVAGPKGLLALRAYP
jgi:outer membrane protein assembly factor BamB